MFGILLTNAFSIIGTIMGVKYASKETEWFYIKSDNLSTNTSLKYLSSTSG
jgi:hypothetical protein